MTVGNTNLNLVRKCNALESLEREVKTRVSRSKDEDGDLRRELFAIKNPEIKQPMAEWLSDRTDEVEALRSDVDAILSGNDQLSVLRMKLVAAGIELGASKKELGLWLTAGLN